MLKLKKVAKITKTCIVAELGEDIEIPLPVGTACVNGQNRHLLLVTGKEFGNPRPLTTVCQGDKVMIYFPRKLYPTVAQILGCRRSIRAEISPRSNMPHIFLVTPSE